MKEIAITEIFDTEGNLIESIEKEIEVPADWIRFQLLLTMNPQYDEIQRTTSKQYSVRRFEVLINKKSEQVDIIAWQWQDIINGLAIEDKERLITTQTIAIWKHIANTCAMPFEFTDEGLIILRR